MSEFLLAWILFTLRPLAARVFGVQSMDYVASYSNNSLLNGPSVTSFPHTVDHEPDLLVLPVHKTRLTFALGSELGQEAEVTFHAPPLWI